ncbi:High mobility group B protein 13, partial [Glycine soja]
QCFLCIDGLVQIKKANPEAEFKEISTMVGAKWKSVTAEENKPYEGIYHAGKEAYLQVIAKEKRETESMRLLEDEQKQRTAMELLEQYMQFKQEAEKDGKKNKKEKDPLKPKHPMSAYLFFTNDRRAALAARNKNLLEVPKITSEEWKNMAEEQKRPYEEMAKKNKEQYALQMEAYKQKKDEEAGHFMKEEEDHMKLQKQEALQLLKKKEKTENIIKIIVLEDTKEYISYVSKEEAKTQDRRPADLLHKPKRVESVNADAKSFGDHWESSNCSMHSKVEPLEHMKKRDRGHQSVSLENKTGDSIVVKISEKNNNADAGDCMILHDHEGEEHCCGKGTNARSVSFLPRSQEKKGDSAKVVIKTRHEGRRA